MHSYRKAGDGWRVGYHCPASGTWDELGPGFGVECEAEAAAFASFMNGGRYNPYEIEAVFRTEVVLVDENATNTYPRPEGMDYEPEKPKAKAKAG